MTEQRILQGDVLMKLRGLLGDSVHCCVTSPPYWGLRSYSTEPQIWDGEEGCEHEWTSFVKKGTSGGTNSQKVQIKDRDNFQIVSDSKQAYCARCSAWKGELGNEPQIDLYISHLVQIFREVRRVLHPSGLVFLNIGDSYVASSQGKAHGQGFGKERKNDEQQSGGVSHQPNAQARHHGLKPKDLCMIPARVALALQADGWWLRSDIIWAKGISFCDTYSGSVMPESVMDRFTNSYEHVFMLAKSQRYFFDMEAVSEKVQDSTVKRYEREWHGETDRDYVNGPQNHMDKFMSNPEAKAKSLATGRHPRSVWAINPANFPGSHFAVMPEKLAEICIKAGTSEKGCCPQCGTPHVRVVERESHYEKREIAHALNHCHSKVDSTGWRPPTIRQNGWRPSCDHGLSAIPCTVLDPFLGSGTTLVVAKRLERNGIGIELNPNYVKLAQSRIDKEPERLL